MRVIRNRLWNSFFMLKLMFFLTAKSQNPFIENKGQFPQNVISKTHLNSGALFMEKGRFTYVFYDGRQLSENHEKQGLNKKIQAHSYKVSFVNSNQNSAVFLNEASNFFENYFIGDKKNWAKEVRSYKKQTQKEIYKGVDLVIEIYKDQLKFELHVEPYQKTKNIKLQYEGVKKMKIDQGDLIYSTSVNTIKEKKPFAYQVINGKQVEVKCKYKLRNNIVSFIFPEGYNEEHKLIIDPILEFSTYSGSNADNFGYTATYDNFGFLYSGSTVFGVGYPTTLGAYDTSYNNFAGGTDIAITKYDTSGTQRIYSTYLGGGKDELPHSMIVNSMQEIFLFGTTGSADFPITSFAYQTIFQGGTAFSPSGIGVNFPDGSDLFVSKLSINGGDLLSSTFIGGSDNDGLNTAPALKYNYADEVRGEIDIDKNNNVYIATCTRSTDFPTQQAFQNNLNGAQEACIVKMDDQLTSIIWSSYLGGAKDDAIYSLALDNEDNIYVTGGTTSDDFPTTQNAYLSSYQDSLEADAFVSKISSDGSSLINSSYYGTNKYDQSYFVEIGKNNLIYLFGQTEAIGTDLVNNATYFQSGASQFIAVFHENLSNIIRSTVVGTGKGTPDISPTAFLVDVCNKIYVAGWGSNLGGSLSTLNMPISINPPAYQTTTDGNDFYLMVIDDIMSSLLYGTYFGGSQSNEHVDGGTSRFDKKGIIYQSVCAGCGGNSDFPIEPIPGAVSSSNNSSNCNNGVFKFNFDFPIVIADFTTTYIGCNLTINFNNLSSSSSTSTVNYNWAFGDGSVSSLENPTHTFLATGEHEITLIATDPGSCNISDTISKSIFILSNSLDTISKAIKCVDEPIHIGFPPSNNPTITYSWTPSTYLSSLNISNPISNTPITTEYQLFISNGSCSDTLVQKIEVIDLELDAGEDTSYCNTPIELKATYFPDTASIIWSTNRDFLDTLSQDSSIIVSSTGVFYIKAQSGSCIEIDSVEIKTQDINVLMTGHDICKGDSVLLEVLNLNQTTQQLFYNWRLFSSTSSTIIDFPDSSQWYMVEVSNTEGCAFKDSIFINVYEKPVIDTLIINKSIVFQGEKVVVIIQTNSLVNWIGFNNSSFLLEDFPSQDFCYNVEVLNTSNCIVRDSICVKVLDVFCSEDSILIPTAFTPNKDNKNEEYFILDKSGIITEFQLEIFNRLGQKVFASNNINEKWDGTFKGKELNPQVFDFYLELKCIGGKELFKKGNLTLIR